MSETRTISGIRIPDGVVAREATEFMLDAATPLLYHHSRRVFLWAALRGGQLGLEYDPELLYVGAMFHDVGLLEGHRSADERFEIDGANAARAFLERHGLPVADVSTVWDSIALHTTRQVPAYKQPEVRLVALGVEYDLFGADFDALTSGQRDAVLGAHPRIDFEVGMIQTLSAAVRHRPDTAVGTMLPDILEATVPGYVRPNLCDRLLRTPFTSAAMSTHRVAR